jgi:hypothetical protein
MSEVAFGVSLFVALILIAGILYLAAREVSAYRIDQATRSEIYPYTKGRLIRRLIVNGCLIGEVVLLALLRFTLSPTRPVWFLIYVGTVLGLVGVMVVMAIWDLRESVRLGSRSMEQLFKEFVHEIRRGVTPPDTH